MEAAFKNKVKKFLFIGSIGQYPALRKRKEEDVWKGLPSANDKYMDAGNDEEQAEPGESARQDVPGAIISAPGPPVEKGLRGDEVLVVVEPDELLTVAV